MKEYFSINNKLKEIKEKLDLVKTEIKYEMITVDKERYNDTKGNLVSYKTHKRKSLVKSRVRELITNEDDWNSCFNETEFEVLRVMTKEQVANAKRFTLRK